MIYVQTWVDFSPVMVFTCVGFLTISFIHYRFWCFCLERIFVFRHSLIANFVTVAQVYGTGADQLTQQIRSIVRKNLNFWTFIIRQISTTLFMTRKQFLTKTRFLSQIVDTQTLIEQNKTARIRASPRNFRLSFNWSWIAFGLLNIFKSH